MSTRITRNSKHVLCKEELESSGEETKSINKPTTKKTTTTSNNNKKKVQGKQKNKNNRGSGSNSDDEYNDHDSNKEYSDVKEKKQQQQQQQQKKKRVSRSRTSSNNNNKKSTTTNGSGGGGGGTAKQKRTRGTGRGGTGNGGNLVKGASAGALASVNNNVETLGESLAKLRFDLELEVVKTIGNNTKGNVEDTLANEESKLKILEKEYAELIAKNKKDEEECYLVG